MLMNIEYGRNVVQQPLSDWIKNTFSFFLGDLKLFSIIDMMPDLKWLKNKFGAQITKTIQYSTRSFFCAARREQIEI